MQSDIPIGILTKNRAVYLHETLKHIGDYEYTVFDDFSDCPIARRYLDTGDEFVIPHKWPSYEELKKFNLQDNPTVTGLNGRFRQFCPQSVGVVNASCWAIRDLFRDNPDSDAVILLQDDIILKPDWYERMTLYPRDRVGIVAGMHLDYARSDYCTAQCYLITREFYENQNWWFLIMRPISTNSFDVKICRKAHREKFSVDLLLPYCCQHIGVESQVRPERPFKTNEFIRMGVNG